MSYIAGELPADSQITEYVPGWKQTEYQPNSSFLSLGIDSFLVKCIEALGLKNPTPIQYYAYKQSQNFGFKPISMICQSKSGTGKTLSYLLVLLGKYIYSQKQRIDTDSQIPHKVGERDNSTFGLILLPTRQLAIQVFQFLKKLLEQRISIKSIGKQQSMTKCLMNISLLLAIGGLPIQDDKNNVQANGAKIVIGTIGRVTELMQRRILKQNSVNCLLLDEYDQLFENKSENFTKLLQFYIDSNSHLLLYSATSKKELISKIKDKRRFLYIQTLGVATALQLNITKNQAAFLQFNRQPHNIGSEIVGEQFSALNLINIHKFQIQIDFNSNSIFAAKMATLIQLLSYLNYQRCLVFVEKKALLQKICEQLTLNEIEAISIHGSMSQASRLKIMNRLNLNKVILASDLLARGIDLKLDLVILFDAKRNETFLHRIGRTGRAGKIGVVISLDRVNDTLWLPYQEEKVKNILSEIQLPAKERITFGEHLTQYGEWKEVDPLKEQEREKQFKYYEEPKEIQQPCKKLKIDGNQRSFEQFNTAKELQQKLLAIKKCSECSSFMLRIQELTGYKFRLKQYIT